MYAVRAHYYTSLTGDDDKLSAVRKTLRLIGFQPHVFKRTGGQKKSKGVDVTLTKDLLVNAFNDNFAHALQFVNHRHVIAITGDDDSHVPGFRAPTLGRQHRRYHRAEY